MVACTDGHFNEYKGYEGDWRYSEEDNVYWGKLTNIEDLVTYEGDTLSELYQSFREAIDDYVEFKNEIGKD